MRKGLRYCDVCCFGKTRDNFQRIINAAEYEERTRTAWTRYANLCRSAAKDAGKLDLVVWPESSTAFEPLTKLDYNPEQLPVGWLRRFDKAMGP